MPQHQVTASAAIKAPAELVYAIIADYHNGHPHILPRPPFRALEVEQGGIGAGTIIRCEMRVLGRMQTFRAAITEPQPGRMLVESFLDEPTVTTFTVDPVDASQCKVTITTQMKVRGWPLGAIQRFAITRTLRPTYDRELEQLARFAECGGYSGSGRKS